MKKAIWALVVIALGIAAYLLFFNKPCEEAACEAPVAEQCDTCACCNVEACDSTAVAE
jgi:hypothetical protein